MNYKILIIILFLFTGCNKYGLNEKSINKKSILKYKNSGFALIYSNILRNEKKNLKKIDNRSLKMSANPEFLYF